MSAIATLWDPVAGIGDWAISVGRSNIIVDQHGASIVDQLDRPLLAGARAFDGGTGLVTDHDLQTAALISLFTDAEASPDDVIPDGSGDPRGWWAGPIGSKLWLRARSKATPGLPALIKDDIEQALAWMIEDDVVATIAVTVEYLDASSIGAQIAFHRADGTQFAVKFARIWENI